MQVLFWGRISCSTTALVFKAFQKGADTSNPSVIDLPRRAQDCQSLQREARCDSRNNMSLASWQAEGRDARSSRGVRGRRSGGESPQDGGRCAAWPQQHFGCLDLHQRRLAEGAPARGQLRAHLQARPASGGAAPQQGGGIQPNASEILRISPLCFRSTTPMPTTWQTQHGLQHAFGPRTRQRAQHRQRSLSTPRAHRLTFQDVLSSREGGNLISADTSRLPLPRPHGSRRCLALVRGAPS